MGYQWKKNPYENVFQAISILELSSDMDINRGCPLRSFAICSTENGE